MVNVRLFLCFCVSVALMSLCFFHTVSFADDDSSPNQLSNGDVVGPLPNSGIGGPGGSVSSLFSPGGILSSGTTLIPSLSGGVSPSILSSLQAVLGNLSGDLQNLFLSKLAENFLKGGDFSQALALANEFAKVQSAFDMLQSIDCGGSSLTSGVEYQLYTQNRLIEEISSSRVDEILSNPVDASALLSDATTSICSGPGSIAGFATGSAGSLSNAGSSLNPYTAVAMASGGAVAPESVTTNGQWTQATSDHIMGRVWSPNSASGTTTCAKGVRLLLGDHPDGLGMPVDTTCHGGARNGQNYHEILTKCNPQWTEMTSITRPEDAPPGCINTYASNCRLGKTPCSRPPASGGQAYGHVEVVATTAEGQKKYVSFKTLGPGGTVKQNYSGTFCCTGSSGCTPSVR